MTFVYYTLLHESAFSVPTTQFHKLCMTNSTRTDTHPKTNTLYHDHLLFLYDNDAKCKLVPAYYVVSRMPTLTTGKSEMH